MTNKVLVDMNLSPEWVPLLRNHGWETIHWATVGDPRASDMEIMAWALANSFVVFTHDLDFGSILALTHVAGPSVLLLREPRVLPEHILPAVVATRRRYQPELTAGALVVVEQHRSRVRVLPFNRGSS